VFAVVCARLRLPLLWVALALLVGGALLGGPGWTGLAGLVLLVAGLALYFRVGTVRQEPVESAPR
jgi:membrane-bound ClpP family serine protease